MKKERKHKNALAGKLPVHQPDKGLWGRINNMLDTDMPVISKKSLSEKMPLHKPDAAVWRSIEKSLPRAGFHFRLVHKAGLIILLFILISGTLYLVSEKSDNETTTGQETGNPETINGPSAWDDIPSSNKSKTVENKDDAEFSSITELDSDARIKPKHEMLAENQNENHQTSELHEPTFFRSPGAVVDEEKNTINDYQDLRPSVAKPKTTNSKILYKGDKIWVLAQGNYSCRGFTFPMKKQAVFELGVFMKPFLVKDISPANQRLVPGLATGISATLYTQRFLFETGVSYNQLEFDDNIDVHYYSYEFLGSVISFQNYEVIEYIDEQGDTITENKYYPELVDLYDSAFQETEQPDRIKLSRIEIPLTVGYRIAEGGKFFVDLKTGLELSVISSMQILGEQTINGDTRDSGCRKPAPGQIQCEVEIQAFIGRRYKNRRTLVSLWRTGFIVASRSC